MLAKYTNKILSSSGRKIRLVRFVSTSPPSEASYHIAADAALETVAEILTKIEERTDTVEFDYSVSAFYNHVEYNA